MSVSEESVSLQQPTAALAQAQPKGAWQDQYRRALVLSDVVAVCLAVFGAQMFRLGRPITSLDAASVYYSTCSVLVIATILAFLAMYRTRSPRIVGAGTEEYRRVLSASLAVVGVIAVALMIFRPEYARGYLLVALPASIGALLIVRHLCRRALLWQRRRGRCVVSVLAVGDARSVRSLVQSLSRGWWYGYEVVGVCLTGHAAGGTMDVPGVGPLPVLGDENGVDHAIMATGADAVALTATEHLGPEGIRELSWRLHSLDVDLVVSPCMLDVAGPRLTMRPVSGLPLIHVEKPQYSGTKKFQKRAFDICLSLTVLLGAAPVMIAAALAIKLTSPGTVFYRSERIGLDGKPFQMIKFRTMISDADKQLDSLIHLNESSGGVLFKIREDPRITKVGRVLRKYSIDELPQFFNVLRRDMSVVGPRPPLKREVDQYDDLVRRRLLVLPGITGLWQVSGRADLTWEDSVRLDLSYVENWSITNDLLIAAKTVMTVAAGSGAY